MHSNSVNSIFHFTKSLRGKLIIKVNMSDQEVKISCAVTGVHPKQDTGPDVALSNTLFSAVQNIEDFV